MRSISFYIKRLVLYLIITIPYFFHINCLECGCQPPAPPPEPEPLIFLDLRLAIIYPVIQLFKNTITSDPLGITQTWTGPNICNYTGFYCDNPPDNRSALAIAAIDFNGFQLAAPTLDGFLDQLPDLAIFHANTNNFSGTISPNITKLPYFYELDISNNKFSGPFPASVLGITDLTFLDVRYNFFTGSVPPQVFMQTLDVLFLNNNNFIQTLPDNLGSTTALYLTFANNKFTGPIPRSIGKANSTLLEVLFLNNELTGCIPYELGFLNKSTVIDIGNNRLIGPLPYSLGCLAAAEQLNFAGNYLYGQVPEVVCALGNLVNLSLSYNYFTSVGPICWQKIKSGVLDVRKNCIYGLHGQRSPAECWWFFWHHRWYHCPYHPALYHFIPCKHPPLIYSYTPPPPPQSTPKGRRLFSYSALLRHRL